MKNGGKNKSVAFIILFSILWHSGYISHCLACLHVFLQNKNKKLDAAKNGGAELVKEDPSSPDTGQHQNQNPSLVTSALKEAAACQATSPGEASPSSVHTTLPNNDNYNLVSSLLNLTKSPVSLSVSDTRQSVLMNLILWVLTDLVSFSGWAYCGEGMRGSDADSQFAWASCSQMPHREHWTQSTSHGPAGTVLPGPSPVHGPSWHGNCGVCKLGVHDFLIQYLFYSVNTYVLCVILKQIESV